MTLLPVGALRVTPAGKDPDEMDQLYGGAPPEIEQVDVYGTPICVGPEDTLQLNAEATVNVKALLKPPYRDTVMA